ncbi:hypothetical protein NEMBOFW57_009292 [Staphylotrichum longicolle]|uniref:Uncharacterized protein n=1 Tax=Staphylotrichum longicolle TaxID=669026 RepID=A0AAD4ENU3_9PEZI|nr:hypothetical protein NEMBOFW57_009292 [Staphylotrichum longicolle]
MKALSKKQGIVLLLSSFCLFTNSLATSAKRATDPPNCDSTYTTDSGSIYQITCGREYYGGDIGFFHVQTFAECIKNCDRLPGCIDVSYANDGGGCWAKSTVNTLVPAPHVWTAELIQQGTAVSAPLDCTNGRSDGVVYTTEGGTAYHILCGQDFAGGDIHGAAKAVSFFEDCLSHCDEVAGCAAVSYANGQCYPKSQTSDEVHNRPHVWGAKVVVGAGAGTTTSSSSSSAPTSSSSVAESLSSSSVTFVESSISSSVAPSSTFATSVSSTTSSTPSSSSATSVVAVVIPDFVIPRHYFFDNEQHPVDFGDFGTLEHAYVGRHIILSYRDVHDGLDPRIVPAAVFCFTGLQHRGHRRSHNIILFANLVPPPAPTGTDPPCLANPADSLERQFHLLDFKQQGFLVDLGDRPGLPPLAETEEQGRAMLDAIEDWVPTLYRFESPAPASGADDGWYDIVVVGSAAGSKRYLSLEADGTIGFATGSSPSTTTVFFSGCNGRIRIHAPDGALYTVHAPDGALYTVHAPDGALYTVHATGPGLAATAVLTEGDPRNDGVTVLPPEYNVNATTSETGQGSNAKRNHGSNLRSNLDRRQSQPASQQVLDRCGTYAIGVGSLASRFDVNDQYGVGPPETNGCGSKGTEWVPDTVLSSNWTGCCNAHDTCYGTCRMPFGTCNERFLDCLYMRCWASVNLFNPPNLLACRAIANLYYAVVSARPGREAYNRATKERCLCTCWNHWTDQGIRTCPVGALAGTDTPVLSLACDKFSRHLPNVM